VTVLSEAAQKDAAMSGQLDYARIANDLYETPPKFVKCLAEHFSLRDEFWWEPASGGGNIARAVEEISHGAFYESDLIIYPHHPYLIDQQDFLTTVSRPFDGITGLVTNPPYETINVTEPEWAHLHSLASKYGYKSKVSLAELFLRHAIDLMEPVEGKVAMFLRNEFDCGKKRMNLFDHPAYAMKIVCTERPRWIEGSTGSPRHNYAWFCFDWKNTGAAQVRYSHPSSAIPIAA
jgi:hypothetical protein